MPFFLKLEHTNDRRNWRVLKMIRCAFFHRRKHTHSTRSAALVSNRKCANSFAIEWLCTFFLIFLLNSFNEVATAHTKNISIYSRRLCECYLYICSGCFADVIASPLKRVSCHTDRAERIRVREMIENVPKIPSAAGSALIQFIEFWRWLNGTGMGLSRNVNWNKSIVSLTSNVCLCFVRLLSMANMCHEHAHAHTVSD